MRNLSFAFFTLCLVVPARAGFTQDAKAPIPDPATQKKAEKLIRDFFSKEYRSKDPAQRRLLAEKLLEQAAQTREDLPTCFVLLRESRNVAGDALDIETAFRAIDRMSELFVLNPAKMKEEVLRKGRRSARRPSDALALAEGYHHLARQALDLNDYALAARAAKDTERLAKTAKDEELAREAGSLAKAIPDLKREFDAASKVDVNSPIDIGNHAVNLSAGRHLCFVKGDWNKGLEFLLWCGNSNLAGAAREDLKNPNEAGAQTALGGMWWDLSEKERNPIQKIRYRSRARHWYERALPKISGLTRARVERRLAAAPASSGRRTVLVELNFEDIPGRWGLEGDYTGGNQDGGFQGKRAARFVLSGEGRAWYEFREGAATNADTISVYARTTQKGKTARLHFMLDAGGDLSVRFKIDSGWKKYTFKLSEFRDFNPGDENPGKREIETQKIHKVGIVLEPGTPRVEVEIDSLRIEGIRK